MRKAATAIGLLVAVLALTASISPEAPPGDAPVRARSDTPCTTEDRTCFWYVFTQCHCESQRGMGDKTWRAYVSNIVEVPYKVGVDGDIHAEARQALESTLGHRIQHDSFIIVDSRARDDLETNRSGQLERYNRNGFVVTEFSFSYHPR